MSKSATTLCLKSYQPFVDTHQHDFHQLVLPVTGCLEIEIGQETGVVNTSQAAVICAKEDHAFESQGNNQFIVADIPTQLAPAFAQLPVFVKLDDNLNRYIHFLQGQLNTPLDTQNLLVQRQMLLLLVQLLDHHHAHKKPDKRVVVARNYLEQHFAHKNVLNNAASRAGLSARHLRQLFSVYYAMSPSQYLLELRMQGAWQMLRNNHYKIQFIAERCGYSNVSAFSDRFHKHFAQTPMQVRKR
ncbi:MAG: AraC family transcriptional regulator [Oceanospirillaceae bacterium]